jgi:predicted RNase H-related nuclease YkuK (DUF458 family)
MKTEINDVQLQTFVERIKPFLERKKASYDLPVKIDLSSILKTNPKSKRE